MADRPPGDGETIDSYGFDLTTCLVPQNQIAPAMKYRDMVPVLDNPRHAAAAAIQEINAQQHGKYLVSSDQVVGVQIDGASRAYPISVLNVHDIINDTLGGRPIAVTYNWLSDTTRVFDRQIDGRTVLFGVSGLVYNSNLLMYDRSADGAPGAESLWSQIEARAVAGPAAAAGERLDVIRSVRTSWDRWKKQHPDTTVVLQDPDLAKRYKHAAPTPYLQSPDVVFPYAPAPPQDGPPAKARVIAVITKDARGVYQVERIAENRNEQNVWTNRLGDTELTFTVDLNSGTITVAADPADNLVEVIGAFWFAWHAAHPQDQLIK
jgi:hypothetical protein